MKHPVPIDVFPDKVPVDKALRVVHTKDVLHLLTSRVHTLVDVDPDIAAWIAGKMISYDIGGLTVEDAQDFVDDQLLVTGAYGAPKMRVKGGEITFPMSMTRLECVLAEIECARQFAIVVLPDIEEVAGPELAETLRSVSERNVVVVAFKRPDSLLPEEVVRCFRRSRSAGFVARTDLYSTLTRSEVESIFNRLPPKPDPLSELLEGLDDEEIARFHEMRDLVDSYYGVERLDTNQFVDGGTLYDLMKGLDILDIRRLAIILKIRPDLGFKDVGELMDIQTAYVDEVGLTRIALLEEMD